MKGGTLFHLISGNLSYQIEHHIYPGLPAYRYRQIAPEVEAICNKHGIVYSSRGYFELCFNVFTKVGKHMFTKPVREQLAKLLPARFNRAKAADPAV